MNTALRHCSNVLWSVGLGVSATLWAAASEAGELYLGVSTSGQYDSNVFASPNAQGDFSVRIGPTFRLEDRTGDLTYELIYRPAYDVYARFNDLDAWEHYATGWLSWRIGPNTTLRIDDTFYDTPTAIRATELLASTSGSATATTVPISVIGSDQYESNTASINLSHNFTARFLGELEVSDTLTRSQQANRSDTDAYTAQGSLLYAWTRTDRIGAGYSATLQQIGAVALRQATSAWYHNVFGVWAHDFSPTWRFRAQAGPTLVDAQTQQLATTAIVNRYPLVVSQQNLTGLLDTDTCERRAGGGFVAVGCSVAPPAVETFGGGLAQELRDSFVAFPIQNLSNAGGGTDITYFADLELTKEWETVTATLSYRRTAGTSSGFGTNTTDDTVRGSIYWRPTRAWTVTGLALWDQEQSVGQTQASVIQIVDATTGFLTLPVNQVDVDLVNAAARNLIFFGNNSYFRAARATGVTAETVKNFATVQRYVVGLTAERLLWRNFTVFGRTSYTHQSTEFGGVSSTKSSYDSVRFELGLRYEFDPIQY